MSDYLVTDTELTATAAALRTKGGTSASIEWKGTKGFADAVAALPSGSGAMTPEYAGLSYGYIALTGKFYAFTANSAYVTLFAVQAGRRYVCGVSDFVSNRLRAQLYYGKTLSDFEQYLTSSQTNAEIYSCDVNLTGTVELTGDALTQRIIVEPSTDGILFVATSNESKITPAFACELPQQETAWKNGTDADVVSAIQAAHAGTVDLQADLGWRVGDVRTIHVNAFQGCEAHAAQDIDIIITSFDDYNNCGCVLQFDFKNTLNGTFRYGNKSYQQYEETDMYTTQLPSLADALPQWLKELLITFDVLAHSATISNNTLALRSATEVGITGYSGDGATIPYYGKDAYRKKIRNYGESTLRWCASRTIKSYAGYGTRCVTYSGSNNVESYTKSANFAIAPFGCI